MIELKPNQNDDVQFVALVSRCLNNLIRVYSPAEIFVVQIDHSFDHKWHRFSGKILGVLGVWHNRLTLPPFDPSRVINQSYFRADDRSRLTYRRETAKPLHRDQWSAHNLQRFIQHVSSSGLFLWYSGETENVDQASLMVYSVRDDQIDSWYASLVKTNGWKLNKSKGVPRTRLDQMIA